MHINTQRLARLFVVASVAFSACSAADTQRANKVAEVVLTQSANLTPGTSSATAGTAVTGAASKAVVTATPSLFYARCLTHQVTPMLLEPNADAPVVISMAARDTITVYGRTMDAKWVLGYKDDKDFGWVNASAIACTSPITELMPAQPNAILLTATAAVAVAQVALATNTSMTPTEVPTQLPTEVLTEVPTEVPTQLPTEAPTKASLVTSTPAKTLTVTPLRLTPTRPPTIRSTPTVPVAVDTPVGETQVVTRIVTIVVTVTVTPRPTLVPAIHAPTSIAVATETPTPTPTPVLMTTHEMACTVTPGTPVNFRRGPARTDPLVAALRAGTAFTAQGRTEDGAWLFGIGPRSATGWLIASSVECASDVQRLPVVDR